MLIQKNKVNLTQKEFQARDSLEHSDTLGETIKNIRKSKDMTQFELGQQIEVTKSYISKIEGNKQLPTIHQIKKISKALQVDYIFLILKTADLSEQEEGNEKDLLKDIIGKFNELNALYNEPFKSSKITNEVSL